MASTPTLVLTEQQQAIVNHNHGPALVFAVAGAGKTTAMVQRIARLVREGIFAPEQILATSFNKAANEEIEAKLSAYPACKPVQVKTLHALGYLICLEAQRRGYLPHVRPAAVKANVEGADRQLLYKTLALARQQRVRYIDDLNRLDHDEFLTYVGACKGNLLYADLEAARLPVAARQTAKPARAPAGMPWFLSLYRLYEEVRRQEGWLTFDDMLMTGWEVLTRHEDVLVLMRRQFQCVLVDEFQDINLAQSELLDLLTWPQRHYMAIGDDDQTIYEWRGASPRFILGFEQRYNAQVYLMTDNFRCTASQVVLANRVIEHNRQRQPKQMRLTQGFQGETQLHLVPDLDQMGRHIAAQIAGSLRNGYTPAHSAVLVRIYAQTPPIEQHLIAAQIPYEIIGSEPFYERAEVRLLLDYCHVAQVEQTLLNQGTLSNDGAQAFRRAWHAIYNQPTRYLTRGLADMVVESVVTHRMPLTHALVAAGQEATERQAKALHQLAADLKWLAGMIPTRRSAQEILHKLEERLQYMAHLKESSASPETGAAKAANVATFIEYAHRKGTFPQFVQHLEDLATQRKRIQAGKRQPAVTITTMYRAKGLEWPLVFVPNCNQGTIPYERMESLEEERRLLYVAITRARQSLQLYALRDQPLSQLLTEAAVGDTLTGVAAIQRALTSDPKSWRTEEMVGLAVLSQRLGLADYFRCWWDAPPAEQKRIATLALRILDSIDRHELHEQLGVQPDDRALWRALLR